MRRLFFLSLASLFLFALNMCGSRTEETTTVIPVTTTTAEVTTTTQPPATTTTATQTQPPTTTQQMATTTSVTTAVSTSASIMTTTQTTAGTTSQTTTPPTTTIITTLTEATTTTPTSATTVTTVTVVTTTTTTETTTEPVTTIPTTTVTTIPETTIPETTTTTEAEFTPIATVLATQPTGEVKVRGIVYYAIPAITGRASYYIYDGTGHILVIDDNAVEIGDGVELTASFDKSEPSPQLINVTSITENADMTVMPEYVVTEMSDIASHPKTDFAFYGSPLTITGVVAPMGPPGQFMLESVPNKVILNGKAFTSGNPFLGLNGQTVTINAVVHFYDDMMSAWHVLYDPAYPIEGSGDPYVDYPFVPGVGGALMLPTPSEPEAGKFGGFMITDVNMEKDSMFGTIHTVADMWFPPASDFGGTSYTLQYYDTGDQIWKNWQHYDEDLTTTGDNFSLRMYESRTLRLKMNGGPMDGYTSNEQAYSLPTVYCDFTGWSVSYGVNEQGIMLPFVGFTIEASFTAINFAGEENVDVSDTLIYKWYRVDPVTYAMTLIAGATGQTAYNTTPADIGYYIAVKAEGDGVDSSGFSLFLLETIVIMGNLGHITDATANGFTVNLFYLVDGLETFNFTVYDQDWEFVQVMEVVQGDNAAIYHVTLNGASITTEYTINYTTDSWAMQFDMGIGGEMHHYMEFYTVQLVLPE